MDELVMNFRVSHLGGGGLKKRERERKRKRENVKKVMKEGVHSHKGKIIILISLK